MAITLYCLDNLLPLETRELTMSGRGQGQVKHTKAGKAGSQPPSKQTKRSNSERSNNDSNISDESLNMGHIQNQLDVMTENLRDLQASLCSVLKKEDIEKLITSTVTTICDTMERRMNETIQCKVNEKTKELSEKLDSVEMENKLLKTKIAELETVYTGKLEVLKEQTTFIENQSKEANIRSNYNEQYSRKNNIKIMEVPEEDGESIDKLTDKVCRNFAERAIHLQKEEIMAIHRIPTKRAGRRPVLIKLMNNAIKTKLMRGRKAMKEAGFRLVDDVTRLNTGLINRLTLHPEIQSAWFFNGSVFGQTTRNERVKFDIFDNIENVISQHRERPRAGRPEQHRY